MGSRVGEGSADEEHELGWRVGATTLRVRAEEHAAARACS